MVRLMSLKEFVATQPDDVLMEELNRRYTDYKDKLTREVDKKFFDQKIQHDWFAEKYDPVRVAQREAKKAEFYQDRLKRFDQAMKSGNGGVLFLDADTERDEEERRKRSSISDRSGGGRCHVLRLGPMPEHVMRASLLALLEKFEGFFKLALSKPDSQYSFKRLGWAFFATPEAASAVYDRITRERLRVDGADLAVQAHKNRISHVAAPGVCLSPQRLDKDLEQASALIQHLDQERALPAASSILQDKTFTEEKAALKRVNMAVAYLREVHVFCYYCAKQFSDFDALLQTCGEVHARDTRSTRSEESQQEFCRQLDEKIAARLAQTLPVSQPPEETVVNKHVNEFIQANISQKVLKKTKDAFACKFCQKMFMASNFVEKHILNKHEDQLEPIRAAGRAKQFFVNFTSDPDRPSLSLFSTAPPPSLSASPLPVPMGYPPGASPMGLLGDAPWGVAPAQMYAPVHPAHSHHGGGGGARRERWEEREFDDRRVGGDREYREDRRRQSSAAASTSAGAAGEGSAGDAALPAAAAPAAAGDAKESSSAVDAASSSSSSAAAGDSASFRGRREQRGVGGGRDGDRDQRGRGGGVFRTPRGGGGGGGRYGYGGDRDRSFRGSGGGGGRSTPSHTPEGRGLTRYADLDAMPNETLAVEYDFGFGPDPSAAAASNSTTSSSSSSAPEIAPADIDAGF